MTWTELTPLGPAPSARHSHSSVVYNGSLYICMGYDGAYQNDVHEYCVRENRWSLVQTAGRSPRERYRATTVVHQKYLILYGGHDGTRHLNDTYILDLDAKLWSLLETSGPSPIPRDSHVSVVNGSSMFVFAGAGSGTALSDLHELVLPTTPGSLQAEWRTVEVASSPRERFCHVGVVHESSLYVFGGYDGRDRLNDFWKFDFTIYDLSLDVPRSTLMHDLRAMINDTSLSDVTFIVEGQPVHAHKLMLMRSEYFRALFLGPMREASMSEIPIPSVRHGIFINILEYLYTDQIQTLCSDNAMEIFEIADLFGLTRLQALCERIMIQSISVETAATVFYAADRHSATHLREKSKSFIIQNFESVSKSKTFEEVGRINMDLIFEILQSR